MKSFVVEKSRIDGRRRLDFSYHFNARRDRMLDHSRVPWIPIGNLASAIGDGPRSVKFTSNGAPYIKLSNLKFGEATRKNTDFIDATAIHDKFRLRKNDILLSKTGSTVRSALVGENLEGAVFAPDIYRIRLKDGDVPPVWISLFFRTRWAADRISRMNYGSTIKRLAIGDLKKIRVPFPSPEIAKSIEKMEEKAREESESAASIFSSTIASLYAEINERTTFSETGERWLSVKRSWLKERWDLPFLRYRNLKRALSKSTFFKPVRELARLAVTSRKHLDPEKEVGYVQISDIDPDYLSFSRVRRGCVKDLPFRIRMPLREFQVLILASGSNLGKESHPIAIVEPDLNDYLGSNAFLALEFNDTPIYYGLVMRHPLVLAQLRGLASDEKISFINKAQMRGVLIPVLGEIRRNDYNERARIAWEKRRLAIRIRRKAAQEMAKFISEILERK